LVGHRVSLGLSAEVRKNRVIKTALTPALSPRRGSAMRRIRLIRASLSAFSCVRYSCRTFRRGKRGDQCSDFQARSIRVPSPGEEGQGEGRPSFPHLHPI
jgi:hypothetical protein